MNLPFQNNLFDHLISDQKEKFRLAEAALLFATDHQPQLKIAPFLKQLDDLAQRTDRLNPGNAAERVQALRQILIHDQGFTGNKDDYYNPSNSYLNEVLQTKKGIPISLSLIWLDIADQLNWPIYGIGMPGRFIIKYQAETEGWYLDPFDHGAELTIEDCQSIVAEIYQQPVNLTEKHLPVNSKSQILIRTLNNLRVIFAERKEYLSLGYTLSRLLALNSDDKTIQEQLNWVLQSIHKFN